jgi:hypothetical protein
LNFGTSRIKLVNSFQQLNTRKIEIVEYFGCTHSSLRLMRLLNTLSGKDEIGFWLKTLQSQNIPGIPVSLIA